jgi:hypothetical protein
MIQEQELRKLQAAMKSAKGRRDFERYQVVLSVVKRIYTKRHCLHYGPLCGYDPPLHRGVSRRRNGRSSDRPFLGKAFETDRRSKTNIT